MIEGRGPFDHFSGSYYSLGYHNFEGVDLRFSCNFGFFEFSDFRIFEFSDCRIFFIYGFFGFFEFSAFRIFWRFGFFEFTDIRIFWIFGFSEFIDFSDFCKLIFEYIFRILFFEMFRLLRFKESKNYKKFRCLQIQ